MENKKINWFPGHMFKAKKEIEARLKSVDGIIEIIDARVPLSSHNSMLEKITKNKNKIILFSKIDLVQQERLNKFKKYYESQGYEVYGLNINNNSYRQKVIKKIEKLCEPIVQKYIQKGMSKSLRLLVIGMPNVGKSSFINMIAGKKKLIIGNTPGVTKAQNIVKITDYIELIDTPGVMVPKIENLETGYNLVLNSLIKEEVAPLQDVAFYLLTHLLKSKTYNNIFMKRYQLDSQLVSNFLENSQDLMAVDELYTDLGKYIGAYSKSQGADYEKISRRIINDYRMQKFGKIILDRLEGYNE